MRTSDIQALESKFLRSTDEAARERREARLVEVAKKTKSFYLKLKLIFRLVTSPRFQLQGSRKWQKMSPSHMTQMSGKMT